MERDALHADLRDNLEAHQVSMPVRNPTLRDVAERVGVSISTVSRALNGQPNVRPEVVELVLRAAEELDYHPNAAARSLRLARSMLIGAVFSHMDNNPITLELFEGVDRSSRERGYSVILGNARGDADEFGILMDQLLERRVDALLVYRPPAEIEDRLALYEEANIPVVALHAKPRGMRIPLVTNRPSEAIATAVETLASLGHRSIGYVASASEQGDFRSQKLSESANARDMSFLVLDVAEGDDHEQQHQMHRVVDHHIVPGGPTALFVRYHRLPYLIGALQDYGLSIPEDISIVSFGEGPWLRVHRPPIASVYTAGLEIGRAAVEVVMDILAGGEPQRVYEVVGANWTRRGSVGPPRHAGVLGSVRRWLR